MRNVRGVASAAASPVGQLRAALHAHIDNLSGDQVAQLHKALLEQPRPERPE